MSDSDKRRHLLRRVDYERGDMALTLNLGAHCGAWGRHANRFNPRGYQEPVLLPQIIRQVATIPDLTGMDLSRSLLERVELSEVKHALGETGLQVVAIAASISGHPQWLRGAFTNPDPGLRRQAIQLVKETMDLALELGSRQVNLWFGREGYDYCFEADYDAKWHQLVDGVRQCAQYRPEVKIALEYKLKEPLSHLVIGTAASTLLLCEDVGEPNVGVLLDTGHALLAQENLAEVVTLLARRGRLFHVHFNDNYRLWDEDMVPGSVHLIEFLEMVYWLDRVAYDGWLMFDAQSPGHEPISIMKTSIAFVKGLAVLLERLDMARLNHALAKGEALTCLSQIQRAMFGDEVVSSLSV